MPGRRIEGIPCYLTEPTTRHAIRAVLRQIGEGFPQDLAKVKAGVRAFVALPDVEAAAGTMGEYKVDDPGEDPASRFQVGPGVVMLSRTAYPALQDAIATVAHELGHAATTFDDVRRRGAFDTAEFASEAAADWYAYRWGFGRAIATHRRLRDFGHHGPAPGSTYSVELPEGTYRYRVSRKFVCRLVSVER